MICHVLVLREILKLSLLDLKPVLGSALRCVAAFLLWSHVRPADPVFVRSLTLQVLQHIFFHLNRDRPGTPILSDPLLPRNTFPQESDCEEHGGKSNLELEKKIKNSS